MKLRMLNGTHTALAYIGTHAGHETVAEAMADQAVCTRIEALVVTGILAPSSSLRQDRPRRLCAKC